MRHRIYTTPISLYIFAAFLCIFGSSAAQRVTGHIIDRDSLPVRDAVVKLLGMNLQCVTDSIGAFSFDNAGVVRPYITGSVTPANLSSYRESYTLSGRRLTSRLPLRATANVYYSGKSFASQVVIGVPDQSVTRQATKSFATDQPPYFDTLLITHDSHLFRKMVVRVDTPTLPPVVMLDTSAAFSWSWEMLDYFFLDRHKLTYDPFGFPTPEALYASVNDPFTVWFPSDSAKRYVGQLVINTIGCGIRFDSVADGYSIKDVFIDSPAERAGIRPGDRIVKVGDRAVAGKSRNELVGYLGGTAGDTVKLTVSTNETLRVVAVILDSFVSPSVFIDSLNGTTAVVIITGFKSGTTKPGGTEEEFYAALEKLAWAKNIIIDLRANGGGFLDQALGCISYIVPPGQPLIRWNGRGLNNETGESEETDTVFTSTPKMKLFVKNMAILADGMTASAAEFFITMVRTALPETKLIGTPTYGKATGQVVLWGPDSTLAKITCMRFLSLEGASYDKVGIQPDVMVAEGENAVDVAKRVLTLPVSGKKR